MNALFSRLPLSLLLVVIVAACGSLEAADVVNPRITEARIEVIRERPFDPALVSIRLGLEAGINIDGRTVELEYVKLFEGSTWRTNEPAVRLWLRLPEEALEPFTAGEERQVLLEGYTPNEDLYRHCESTMRLLVATRTSGVRTLAGTVEDVLIECAD